MWVLPEVEAPEYRQKRRVHPQNGSLHHPRPSNHAVVVILAQQETVI
jgi:hypothetical protein